ncbi:MAG TPA: hypothetical protein VFO05_07900 [Candidatus Limnocylindrales bacterium]|nr:hypothetical protein [Candidatus Limnocylindrales bacterium]
MRGSNHRAGWVRALAAIVVMSTAVAACGTSAAEPSAAPPTAPPTPAITPDPHLSEPATADQIFNAIRVGDLPLTVNNAVAGDASSPVVKQINAAVANWPLIISEYRSSSLLRDSIGWDPAAGPRQGDAPYTWVGLNILVSFGPTTGRPVPPDATRQQQARDLIALIDPLLWPMQQRALIPVPTKSAPPASSQAPAASAPTSSATP